MSARPAQFERRRCPICTSSFVANPRQPTHTYCTTRCRRIAYERRHTRPDGVPDSVAHGVPDGVGDSAPASEQEQPAAQRPGTDRKPDGVPDPDDAVPDAVRDVGYCPHCRQPIAVVTLLLTQTAAHVTVPAPPDTPKRREQ